VHAALDPVLDPAPTTLSSTGTSAGTSTSTSNSLITMIWRSVLPSADEVRRARRRLHFKALAIAALLATSYYWLVIADSPLLIRLAAAAVLVVSVVAVGTGIMHDANHGSFSRHRWLNRLLAYSSDALGASSWLWRIQHNAMHHGNTNVVGQDADLSLAPFARLAPSQPWHRWHRAQHIYMWPLYGFLTLKNLLVSDLVSLVQGKMDGRPLGRPVRAHVVLRVVAGKLAHASWAIVLPLMFNPWWAVLAGYVACSWLVGFVLAITFQLAHCVDAAEVDPEDTSRRGDDFVAHQLRTTVDIATPFPVGGHLVRWLVGGLDHQIEHHLAPRLPHTLYAKVAARFRAECALHGVTYRVHKGVGSAIASHARWLRAMGMRPPAGVGGIRGIGGVGAAG